MAYLTGVRRASRWQGAARAAEAGADVRTRTGVTGLLRDGKRVTGVETGHGPIRASLVVGADGRHSTVARLAGGTPYYTTGQCRPFTWAYFDGVADTETTASRPVRRARLSRLPHRRWPVHGRRHPAQGS
ncbi:MAG TPA: FAD-dependent monooxygenase [Pseudonocardia sp.]|nr:FAD-dependent monooxygenase [Pseudonocardia sp.]